MSNSLALHYIKISASYLWLYYTYSAIVMSISPRALGIHFILTNTCSLFSLCFLLVF